MLCFISLSSSSSIPHLTPFLPLSFPFLPTPPSTDGVDPRAWSAGRSATPGMGGMGLPGTLPEGNEESPRDFFTVKPSLEADLGNFGVVGGKPPLAHSRGRGFETSHPGPVNFDQPRFESPGAAPGAGGTGRHANANPNGGGADRAFLMSGESTGGGSGSSGHPVGTRGLTGFDARGHHNPSGTPSSWGRPGSTTTDSPDVDLLADGSRK